MSGTRRIAQLHYNRKEVDEIELSGSLMNLREVLLDVGISIVEEIKTSMNVRKLADSQAVAGVKL